MAEKKHLVDVLTMPEGFSINGVLENAAAAAAAAPAPVLAPNLGPLAAFVGAWTGRGFNTIFRPDSAKSPTPMPGPVNTTDPPDNVLELNLTNETLSFAQSLGSIPNRGNQNQADAFLNGVPYLQSINDITTSVTTGIHFEPGIWLAVPASTNPTEPITVARMASIPHGTTIVAQGIALAAIAGKPKIGAVDITPFQGGNPGNKITFQNQTATNKTTRRIPQDLTAFINAGKITQAMLSNPNTLLDNQIQNQRIAQTIVIVISTKPGSPLPGGPLAAGQPSAPSFGGGTSDIAFLLGQSNPPAGGGPNTNANAFQMDAVFWIETVLYDVQVPPLPAGTPPVVLGPVQNPNAAVPLVPSFVASIPFVPGKGFKGGVVNVATTQIQYSQKVVLDFNGLTWPHVSVASLVPAASIPIPQDLLPLT